MFWRRATLLAMLLVILEGAIRKWVFPQAEAALYLFKDVLLLLAFALFAMSRGLRLPVEEARPFVTLLAVAAFFGALQMFNPSVPSLPLAVVGWRSYFFYAPLIFLVPYLFDSQDQLYRALERYALLAIPVAAVGIIQFFSPADSELNAGLTRGGETGAAISFADEEGRVRVAGPFAFISGYTSYLLAVAVLITALLAGRKWALRPNLLLWAALVLTIGGMFATGSRAPVYSLAAALAAYFVLAALLGDLRVGVALRAGIAMVLVLVAVQEYLPEPSELFRQRATQTEDNLSRFTSQLVEPFMILDEAGVFGFGIGTAHQSASYLTGSDVSYWTKGLVVEAESSRIMLEQGIIGFVLAYLFRIGISVFAFRVSFRIKSPRGRALALLLAMFFVTQIFGAVIFNPTMNLLYWFAVGLLFALYRFHKLETRAVVAAKQVAAARPRGLMGGKRTTRA